MFASNFPFPEFLAFVSGKKENDGTKSLQAIREITNPLLPAPAPALSLSPFDETNYARAALLISSRAVRAARVETRRANYSLCVAPRLNYQAGFSPGDIRDGRALFICAGARSHKYRLPGYGSPCLSSH